MPTASRDESINSRVSFAALPNFDLFSLFRPEEANPAALFQHIHHFLSHLCIVVISDIDMKTGGEAFNNS